MGTLYEVLYPKPARFSPGRWGRGISGTKTKDCWLGSIVQRSPRFISKINKQIKG